MFQNFSEIKIRWIKRVLDKSTLSRPDMTHPVRGFQIQHMNESEVDTYRARQPFFFSTPVAFLVGSAFISEVC